VDIQPLRQAYRLAQADVRVCVRLQASNDCTLCTQVLLYIMQQPRYLETGVHCCLETDVAFATVCLLQ
jgi:hypothetical protein